MRLAPLKMIGLEVENRKRTFPIVVAWKRWRSLVMVTALRFLASGSMHDVVAEAHARHYRRAFLAKRARFARCRLALCMRERGDG